MFEAVSLQRSLSDGKERAEWSSCAMECLCGLVIPSPPTPSDTHAHSFLDSSVLLRPLFASAPLLVAFMLHVQDLCPPPLLPRHPCVYILYVFALCALLFPIIPLYSSLLRLSFHLTERDRHAYTHTITYDYQDPVRS